MIGGGKGTFPGIAPRAYSEIFELLHSNEKKFSFAVSVSFLSRRLIWLDTDVRCTVITKQFSLNSYDLTFQFFDKKKRHMFLVISNTEVSYNTYCFIQVYMVELYNDQLLDLFDKAHTSKLDIKKDKKGKSESNSVVFYNYKRFLGLPKLYPWLFKK